MIMIFKGCLGIGRQRYGVKASASSEIKQFVLKLSLVRGQG